MCQIMRSWNNIPFCYLFGYDNLGVHCFLWNSYVKILIVLFLFQC